MSDVQVVLLAMVWIGASMFVSAKAGRAGRRADLWIAASLIASPSFTYGLLVLLEANPRGSAQPSNLPI